MGHCGGAGFSGDAGAATAVRVGLLDDARGDRVFGLAGEFERCDVLCRDTVGDARGMAVSHSFYGRVARGRVFVHVLFGVGLCRARVGDGCDADVACVARDVEFFDVSRRVRFQRLFC